MAWWRTHQVAVVGLYAAAAALGWQVKEWTEEPVTVSVFIGLGAAAAVGGLLRGHLVFTQYVNRPNLATEQRRTARALLVVDLLMGSALAVDAIMLAAWPLTAVLTLALGIGIAVAALVFEPATTRATLGNGNG
jgi:hypothetical protein